MAEPSNTDSDLLLLKGVGRARHRSPEQSLDQVRDSVYRWWWEYLRLSRDYWLVCQTSHGHKVETRDPELARVYRRFGDIHRSNFEEWWVERGSWVFRERNPFPKVVELPRQARERATHRLRPDSIWVDIPLTLSRRTIQRQIGRILDTYQEQRPTNRLATSTSEFRLNPVPFRLLTLRKMYEVYSLHRELIDKPRALRVDNNPGGFQQRADLFRIGKLLRVSPSNESLRGEPEVITKRQNRMRASVGRLLRRTELAVANAERGVFPSFKLPEAGSVLRFNTQQLAAHLELERKWWELNLTSTLSTARIDEARRVHYREPI